MTYPGTIQKSFYEVMCEQAAKGNPAAMAFVRKREGIGEEVKKTPKAYEYKYLPPIDPEAEAEVLREEAKRLEKANPPKTWPEIPPKAKENPAQVIKTCSLPVDEKIERIKKARTLYG